MKNPILFFLLLLVPFFAFPEEDTTKDYIFDPVHLVINKNAFDENSIFTVNDEEGRIICEFDRFDNKSSAVNSIKIFNDNKEHIYTITADDQGQTIFILNKDGRSGKIVTKTSVVKFKIKIDTIMDYFGEPYDFQMKMDFSDGGISVIYRIYYNSELVIKQIFTGSFGSSSMDIVAEKSFLDEHKLDCGVLVLAILAFDEMSNSSGNK